MSRGGARESGDELPTTARNRGRRCAVPAGQCGRINDLAREMAALRRRAARAIEAKRRCDEQRRAVSAQLCEAENRERRRVAEGLHDEVSQLLAALSLQMQVLGQVRLPQMAQEALARARSLLDRVSRAVRTTTFELCPPMLYELGLVAALEWLVDEFRCRGATRFDFEVRGLAAEVPREPRSFVFRAVRELLSNVVEHADARSAQVLVQQEDGWLRVCVADDGVGFDASRTVLGGTSKGGFGLFSLRERARGFGGRLEIDAAPGRGSRITLVLGLSCE